MPPQSLILADSSEKIKLILKRATSFSCSVGGNHLEAAMLSFFNDFPILDSEGLPPSPLFCCENDHVAVQKLKSSLKGKINVRREREISKESSLTLFAINLSLPK